MARSSVSFSKIIPIAISLFFLSGCDATKDGLIGSFNEAIGKKIGLVIQNSAKISTPEPSPSDSPSPLTLTHKQINAEFIKEMFKVVLQREIQTEDEFLRYMNILDQGGHYEGIYNGVVYSTEYKAKEKGSATISALKTYANVMATIILAQKYDPLKVKKAIEEQDVPPSSSDLQSPQPTEQERNALIASYEQEGISQSFYTLKRRLGEETLKTIEIKKEYREKLATWYAKFVIFMNKKGVDFGLEQRNKQDEYYHYQWALNGDEDRIKWECLNRVHMLMNAQLKTQK